MFAQQNEVGPNGVIRGQRSSALKTDNTEDRTGGGRGKQIVGRMTRVTIW